MGRRRQRKNQRRQDRRQRDDRATVPQFMGPPPGDDFDWVFGDPYRLRLEREEPSPTCGRCREFIEDGEFGRGSCLHPASGVLSPWDDTPACDYFARAGQRR